MQLITKEDVAEFMENFSANGQIKVFNEKITKSLLKYYSDKL